MCTGMGFKHTTYSGRIFGSPGTKLYTAILFIMAGVSLYLLNCEEDSKN